MITRPKAQISLGIHRASVTKMTMMKHLTRFTRLRIRMRESSPCKRTKVDLIAKFPPTLLFKRSRTTWEDLVQTQTTSRVELILIAKENRQTFNLAPSSK